MTPGNVNISVPILNWFDEPIKQAIKSVFDDINNTTEALDIFKKYRRNHFQRLVESIRHVKILGMNQPIPLTDIYSPAMVSTTIFGRLYEQEWLSVLPAGASSPVRRRQVGRLTRADEFIEAHVRVSVLGSAGSGKTTLLRHIALAMCDKKVFTETKFKTSTFPFFVHLPKYARDTGGSQSISDYLATQLERYTDSYAPQFVQRLLRRGLASLLLDSLDEVPPSVREVVVEQIRETSRGYPECRIVVSCRTADYDPISDDFYEVEMARLTEPAVRTIVKAWFREDRTKERELLRHLKRDEAVRSLCETPLLLSLLCIQFRHDLALPKRKTELFKRCIDAFLRDWDASRSFRRDTVYSSLSDDRKERIFENVASRAVSGGVRYTFPEEDVVQCIEQCCDLFGLPKGEARGILDEIETHHGILERYSVDSYMFSHPSFQEYFVARNLLVQRRELEVIRRNFDNEGWAGVIEFAAALLGDPAPLLKYLAKKSEMESIRNFPTMARRTRTLLLLYRCLSSGVNIANRVREELYGEIVAAHRHMSAIFRNGGVFPMAILVKDGVRHSYLYVRRRPTLAGALRPLRRLGNEILLSPSELYADIALRRLREISLEGSRHAELEGVAEALCLAVPIAPLRPREVRKILTSLKDKDDFVARLVGESLEVMEREFSV